MDSFQQIRTNFTGYLDKPDHSNTIEKESNLQLYDTNGHVRNLCFEWQDGNRALFNYAYLVSVRLILTEALNIMELIYTSNIVSIKGYNLSALFSLLMDHIPRTIPITNPRYILTPEKDQVFVTEISINKP